MEQNLRDALEEYRASLAELDSLLALEPGSRDLSQVSAELLILCQQTEEALAAATNPEPATFVSREDEAVSASNAPQQQIRNETLQIAIGPLPQRQKLDLDSDSRRNPNIHPSNVYAAEEPNFAKLASMDARLRPFVGTDANGRGFIDFRDPNASRELTRALLKADYGIDWWVEEGQLIPAVTNRANYIHWLQDLLRLSSPAGIVRGLDIGCGANLIYCLLGAVLCGWSFVGVDVTKEAQQGAERNKAANPGLATFIELRVKQQDPVDISKGILLPAVLEGECFAFTMCNPPFFASLEEAGQNPATAFEGTAAEMVCPGGEQAFVMQMLRDSLQLKGRVHWYTSMVGKKATLKAVRQELHNQGVTALRVTEFAQGKTSRWGIAWSFVEAARATETAPLPRQELHSRPLVVKRKTVFALQGRNVQPQQILAALAGILSAQGGQCTTDLPTFTLTAAMPLHERDHVDREAAELLPAKRQRREQQQQEVARPGKYSVMVSVVVERQGLFAVQAKVPQQSSDTVARAFTGVMRDAESDVKQILGIR